LNILFLCSRNQWRSPTAERIFQNIPGIFARSAGTENAARIKVSEKMLLWADLIFVMEKKHKERINTRFPTINVPMIVLDIPDDYQFMDPELVEMLKVSVGPYLKT
jgi:protein-tyrosine phosphatase